MPAFALPSFYDGRVRINLKGREARGKVELADYKSAIREIERMVRECTDPATGETVVDFVEYTAPPDPIELHETQADLVFVWKGAAAAFQHPVIGRIGPLPYRRTGGHTGASGVAYVRATGLAAGERGTRSAYDVVPTIIAALGEEAKCHVSGSSFLSRAELLQSGPMRV
jgi:predicted AlkP superfamily phosphohydrolase/phosphomutase